MRFNEFKLPQEPLSLKQLDQRCKAILPRCIAAARKFYQQDMANKQLSPQEQQANLQRFDQSLQGLTIEAETQWLPNWNWETGLQWGVGTSASAGLNQIKVKWSQEQYQDDDSLTWGIAHELAHILDGRFFRYSQGKGQTSEQFADQLGTEICKTMGITKASYFRNATRDNPEVYKSQMNPDNPGSASDPHGTFYQRRQRALQQGFDLSKGTDPEMGPTA